MTRGTARFLFSISLMGCLLTLGACAPLPQQSDQPLNAKVAIASARDSGATDESLRELLKQADTLQSDGRHEQARMILTSDIFENATRQTDDQRWLLALRSAIALKDKAWAGNLTDQADADQFLRYPDQKQPQAAELQAKAAQIAGRPLTAARVRIAEARTVPGTDIQKSHDQIWNLLKRSSQNALVQESGRALGSDDQGWLELALRLRNAGISLDAQARAIRQWQGNWPEHPAARALPGELATITSLSSEQPKHIAVALPQSGQLASAGSTVRDGFLARYYELPEKTRQDITLDFYDSTGQDFNDLYREMIQSDPDLVVGPLSKSAVSDLSGQSQLPVPVLALNYSDQTQNGSPANLYQFGLSVEDEARQIAERLIADDRPQAVALVPWGDWGDRITAALRKEMTDAPGNILDIVRFDPEESLKTVVAKLFRVDVSRDRAIRIERTIGLNVEFEPRRRQDIDAVIMVASPTTARQLKPMFAFYYGGDLPVYAPSTVYTGRPDGERDNDLENVVFTDIPWVLDPPKEFKTRTSQALPAEVTSNQRLFALGADAWKLATKVHMLRHLPQSRLQGLTGDLTMTPDGLIHREQLWARFVQGQPQLLREAPSSDNGNTEERTTEQQ